jgi:lysophospholipase L1-like esterase
MTRAPLRLARLAALALIAGLATAPRSTLARDLLVVALGDSTTAVAKNWAPEIDEVYADCLPRALAPHGFRATVVNAGIGDTTTRDAVARLDRDVRAHHPQLVVIQFGINDSWIDADEGKSAPRLTRHEFCANLRIMTRRLAHDGAWVVLMTPNPMRWLDPFYVEVFRTHPGLLDTDAPRGIDRLLDDYAADVRRVARREHATLVDVHRAFEHYGQEPGRSIDELLLAGDGIHPNRAGQQLVCRLLAERIAKSYPDRPEP